MSENEKSRSEVLIEGAAVTPDWSKAIAFAAGQPPVLPLVCQDLHSGQVLMLGYVSQESLAESISCGQVVFWSRSRAELWKKGATSGHVFNIRRLLLDCDGDTLLALVEAQGPACHRNSTTCFDAQKSAGEFAETDVGWSVLSRLFTTMQERAGGADKESYTYKLLQAGIDRVLRKLGEESTETILAAKNTSITGDAQEFLEESADLLYHWLATLIALEKKPSDVMDVLRSREGGPRRPVTKKV
ncbi:MAG: hypothetical protein RLZZ488_2385 [Pseudomonadota bacterium]|jgi:phosphoribosyl-ATP pyrophosphohydrolase/phosphoribosyl-AMP cyclohydrolase